MPPSTHDILDGVASVVDKNTNETSLGLESNSGASSSSSDDSSSGASRMEMTSWVRLKSQRRNILIGMKNLLRGGSSGVIPVIGEDDDATVSTNTSTASVDMVIEPDVLTSPITDQVRVVPVKWSPVKCVISATLTVPITSSSDTDHAREGCVLDSTPVSEKATSGGHHTKKVDINAPPVDEGCPKLTNPVALPSPNNASIGTDLSSVFLNQYLDTFLGTEDPSSALERRERDDTTRTNMAMENSAPQVFATPLFPRGAIMIPKTAEVCVSALSAESIGISDIHMPSLMSGTVEDNDSSDDSALFPLWPAPFLNITRKRDRAVLTHSVALSRTVPPPPPPPPPPSALSLSDGRSVRFRISDTVKFTGTSTNKTGGNTAATASGLSADSKDTWQSDLKALSLIATHLGQVVRNSGPSAVSEVMDAYKGLECLKGAHWDDVCINEQRDVAPVDTVPSNVAGEMLKSHACDTAARQDLTNIAKVVESERALKSVSPSLIPPTFSGPLWLSEKPHAPKPLWEPTVGSTAREILSVGNVPR
eukprot:gene27334-34035_t